MVGASWSRDELALMLRAWDDALDVPPHRGFRLLEHMFRRFTELCGGHTDRTVGSMEIKRKYMKNMVDVIAQFNNLHGRNGDGHDVDREEYDGSVVIGGTVDNTSLVSAAPSQQQQQARWFEMKRSERKQWFLRLNTKSYKFANIDEETFSSVYKLMQIERVVYGDTITTGEEEVVLVDHARTDESVTRYSDATPRSIRVALVRNSVGDWVARQTNEPQSRPTAAPEFTRYPSATTTTTRMPAERILLPLRRDDSAFDRLLASSSGRHGDTVMIDSGSWSDDSDSDESVDSDEDDGDDTNSYDWTQARHLASLHFQNQSEGEVGVIGNHRQTGSEYMEVRKASNANDVHSDREAGSMIRAQYHRHELTANPQLRSAVQSLEAQAAELREILNQEREERQREEQIWQSEMMRRDCERQEFTELVAQISSSQQGDAKLQELRDEVLALIRSEEEERRKEDEAEMVEQDEHNRFLDEIKRDGISRMKFKEVHRRELAEKEALVELLKQERTDRQRKITERMEILNQIKLLQPKDRKPSEVVGEEVPDTRSIVVNSKATSDPTVPMTESITNSEPQSQDAETGRPMRRSSTQPTQRGVIVSPLRTRSGKMKARTTLR